VSGVRGDSPCRSPRWSPAVTAPSRSTRDPLPKGAGHMGGGADGAGSGGFWMVRLVAGLEAEHGDKVVMQGEGQEAGPRTRGSRPNPVAGSLMFCGSERRVEDGDEPWYAGARRGRESVPCGTWPTAAWCSARLISGASMPSGGKACSSARAAVRCG
jgi:hypothetical protein